MSYTLLVLKSSGSGDDLVFLKVSTMLAEEENFSECAGHEVQAENCPEHVRSRICQVFYRANLTFRNHALDAPTVWPDDPKAKYAKRITLFEQMQEEEELAGDWKNNPGPERDLAQYRVDTDSPRLVNIDRIIVMSFSC